MKLPGELGCFGVQVHSFPPRSISLGSPRKERKEGRGKEGIGAKMSCLDAESFACWSLAEEPAGLQEDPALFGEEGCLDVRPAKKGLKLSRSAQSVRLACNNQLTKCNCANPYVAVITGEINGFLPF